MADQAAAAPRALPPSTSRKRRLGQLGVNIGDAATRKHSRLLCDAVGETVVPGAAGAGAVSDHILASQLGRVAGGEAAVATPLGSAGLWDALADGRCVLRPGMSVGSCPNVSSHISKTSGSWQCTCGTAFTSRRNAAACLWSHAVFAAKQRYDSAMDDWTSGAPGASLYILCCGCVAGLVFVV